MCLCERARVRVCVGGRVGDGERGRGRGLSVVCTRARARVYLSVNMFNKTFYFVLELTCPSLQALPNQ